MSPLDVHPCADGLRPVANDPLFIRIGSLPKTNLPTIDQLSLKTATFLVTLR
jgi:hypothetical protein